MDKKTSLGRNILIFGLGTSLSKIMSVLLVGLYTRFITAEDFGYYDILYTVILMMTPLITLQISDALYRNLLDSRSDEDAGRTVSGAFFVAALGLFIAVAVINIINLIYDIRFGWILPGYFITTIMLIFSQQTARGLRRNTVYAASGVVYTFIMLAANIIFIVALGFGVEALFYSVMIADAAAVLLIEFTVRVYRRVRFTLISPEQLKTMCRYSVPLLPNALMWGLLMLICRLAIRAHIGGEANGIFAASAKFPALLMTLFNVFGLAWQESAIEQYSSEDRNEFYSKTFNMYMRLLLSSLLVLLAVTRGVTLVLIGAEFSSAWLYVPFLYFGSVFAAFSQFYGTGYLSSKKTVGAFVTTFAGVCFGLLFLLLIPFIGLQAASLAQMAAYFAVFLTRVIHTRRFFRIRLELPVFIFLSALTGVFTYCYFLADLRAEAAMLCAAAAVFIIFNRDLLNRLLKTASNTLRKAGGKP
jgi:O-antigen/teichoic acid export membrane protein